MAMAYEFEYEGRYITYNSCRTNEYSVYDPLNGEDKYFSDMESAQRFVDELNFESEFLTADSDSPSGTENRTEISESERESVLHEEILHVLCEAITLMDQHQEYGMGDELFEAVIALKHEWGIPYDYDEEADERENERRI